MDDADAAPPQGDVRPGAANGRLAARPAWMDLLFAVAVAVGFGLSLMRTPTTWLWAAGVFLVGSVAYAILRLHWGRTHPQPAAADQRTRDGLFFLGLFILAFALAGLEPPEQWRIPYAVGAGLLIGGAGFLLLRREEARRLSRRAAAQSDPDTRTTKSSS